jgi:hypothetical protein
LKKDPPPLASSWRDPAGGQRSPGGVLSEVDGVDQQVDAGPGAPVALRQAGEAQPLVEPLRRRHAPVGREHHPPLASGPGPLQAGGDQQLADPPALHGRVDDEHPERRLVVGLGHLAELAGQHQRHAADDVALVVPGDEQLGPVGAPGHVAQLLAVLGGRQPAAHVDLGRELPDPWEVVGAGAVDGQGRRVGDEDTTTSLEKDPVLPPLAGSGRAPGRATLLGCLPSPQGAPGRGRT